MRLGCLSRVHVARSAVYACIPVDACSVDCLSLKIMDSTLVSSRACPGLSVMLHIEDTVPVLRAGIPRSAFVSCRDCSLFFPFFKK